MRAPFFQRLRNIKQLGFSEYVFPGATHTRFLHSIGVLSIGDRAFDKLFSSHKVYSQNQKEFFRLKETFKLACLLHDVGHAPLSHTTEYVMPPLKELHIPHEFLDPFDQKNGQTRRATHEDYTIKAIADSSFSQCFYQVENSFGVERNRVADLIRGKSNHHDYFTVEGIDYFPLLHQLVSSELDCDRMDYLLRDSYFCGVSYGSYDLDWLLDNLHICVDSQKKQAFLGISERAVVTFDDFLLSRYHMFVMVYFHYRAVCLEQLLYKYFQTSPEEYKIPAEIEDYIHHDDHYLMKIMRNSANPYAKEIIKNRIPPKIYESFNDTQLSQLEKVQDFLESNKVEYIRCSSRGRLSKYYHQDQPSQGSFPMKVVRNKFGKTQSEVFNIVEATELFQKFSKSHEINRLHCSLDLISPQLRQEIENMITL